MEELEDTHRSQDPFQPEFENEDIPSIAERVRFWEEQDKINRELIPRVIRHNELLTKHIAEHDNLPKVASTAISQTLAKVKEEHRQWYEAALNASKEEHRQWYKETLKASKAEQLQEYEAALDATKNDLAGQFQDGLDEALASLLHETRKIRNVLVVIASGAGMIGVAALVVSLITLFQ